MLLDILNAIYAILLLSAASFFALIGKNKSLPVLSYGTFGGTSISGVPGIFADSKLYCKICFDNKYKKK